MRITSIAGALLLAVPLAAQAPQSGPVLTLEEAVRLAVRNNPLHQQTITARARAGSALRSSYGALLPNISTSFSSQYREGRPQFFAGQQFGSASDVLSSSGDVRVSLNLSGASLMAPRSSKASLEATEAEITSSEQTLRSTVIQQYLTVLQSQSRAVMQETLLVGSQAQLELARARAQVGAANQLDVRRAEVAVGQQQVALLQARNQVEVEKLRLFQQMGVPQPPNVQLTTQFPVVEPTVKLDELLDMARRGNPQLNALRSRERASSVGVKQARSDYLPSLSLSTGIGGFSQQLRDIDTEIAGTQQDFDEARANCFSTDSIRRGAGLGPSGRNCSGIVFTPDLEARMRAENAAFPFDMTRDPITFSATLSLPLFDGFQREARIQEATASRRDAQYRVREQELRLTADVTTAHLNLTTAYRTVQLQEENARTARTALALAEERFRVGATSFIEVTQARSDYERAETDRINAVYGFHQAFATLEAAVGRTLR
ncbi:MAG TPA: TolC family protein [Gemmatimonadaceae bacterium]|nr:TolC family protein [Gemmatimonadaceae bacterium]